MTHSLSATSMTVIQNYLHMALSGDIISCPYYNNRHANKHGGLAVYVGKGSAQDIIDEALAIAVQKHIDLTTYSSEDRKKFLVDHGLGIDCSGLAYHILDAEVHAKKNLHLRSVLQFAQSKNPLRNMVSRLRPSENTNVKTFAANENSTVIDLQNVSPGDMIIMLGSGRTHDRDHMLIVHEVEQTEKILVIYYTHALDWRTDGMYHHGVRQGTITITDPQQPLIAAVWSEQHVQGEQNETYERAASAQEMSIRRLRALDTLN